MQVPIVFCADGNYGQYLTVTVQSIIENSSIEHEYHIIIFDCGIKADDLAVLEWQISKYDNFTYRVEDISSRLRSYESFLRPRHRWSTAAYGRFFIPDLCSGYEKVIYADVDMVFNRDIAKLLYVDLGSNYIAGVPEVIEECERYFRPKTKKYLYDVLGLGDDDIYINSGLLVFNIRQWSDRDLTKKAFDLLKAKNLRLIDQDAINSVCKGKIVPLGYRWNYLTWPAISFLDKYEAFIRRTDIRYLHRLLDNYHSAYNDMTSVLHWNQPNKPWHDTNACRANFWWAYAEKTALSQQYMRAYIQNLSPVAADRRGTKKTLKVLGIPLMSMESSSKSRTYYFCNVRIAKTYQITK